MSSDFSEDLIGGGRPYEGLGILVVDSQLIGTGLFKFAHATPGLEPSSGVASNFPVCLGPKH